ncbi:60S ribosomal protein L31 [Candidatus Woesearchaeota archaeon]|nr:60S ribosomal protein L31 [Candidatus Woesearchaeota archaeon]MBW2994531.1 60S ribosomal protein L31 [Candidatus Woesearchaeota archaeon]
MATLERTYIIPLRREWRKSPRYRRAKKAVTAVKDFLIKHMKSEDIKIGKYLNEMLWKHGIKNPPCRIKVNVQKDDQNTVRAELFGKKIDTGEKKEVKEKGIVSKMTEKITGKKAVVRPKKEEKVKKTEEKPTEVKKEMPKAEEKEEAPKEEKPAVKEEVKESKPKEEAKPAVTSKDAKPEVRQKPVNK